MNGRTRTLGQYKSAKKAAEAYNKAAEAIHGEFARINKIEGPKA